MNQPRQFQLIPGEVLAIQRNGTPRRDLEIAEWMERSQPYGEYRAASRRFRCHHPDRGSTGWT